MLNARFIYFPWRDLILFFSREDCLLYLHGESPGYCKMLVIFTPPNAHARAARTHPRKPAQQIGTAVRSASMRAVDKQGDFLLLEADGEADGGGGGAADGGGARLGWADASCVVPTSFPALFEFAGDLPDAVCYCCMYTFSVDVHYTYHTCAFILRLERELGLILLFALVVIVAVVYELAACLAAGYGDCGVRACVSLLHFFF